MGPGQYNTNSGIFFFCFDLSFILKFLINTREIQELLRVEPGTSADAVSHGLLDFDCPLSHRPQTNIYDNLSNIVGLYTYDT